MARRVVRWHAVAAHVAAWLLTGALAVLIWVGAWSWAPVPTVMVIGSIAALHGIAITGLRGDR